MNSLTLPDIATQTITARLPLERVGMASITQPILPLGQRLTAQNIVGVSLDDAAARPFIETDFGSCSTT
ncbi:hypothetical protein D3C78_1156780 [compost metagenome]